MLTSNFDIQKMLMLPSKLMLACESSHERLMEIVCLLQDMQKHPETLPITVVCGNVTDDFRNALLTAGAQDMMSQITIVGVRDIPTNEIWKHIGLLSKAVVFLDVFDTVEQFDAYQKELDAVSMFPKGKHMIATINKPPKVPGGAPNWIRVENAGYFHESAHNLKFSSTCDASRGV